MNVLPSCSYGKPTALFCVLQPSPQIRHVDAYLPHRAILTGKMKVTMTTILWIHDPDRGMLALQRNVDIMRSTDSRIKREKSPKEAIRDSRYARSRKGSQSQCDRSAFGNVCPRRVLESIGYDECSLQPLSMKGGVVCGRSWDLEAGCWR
jgi:hypothetical protein